MPRWTSFELAAFEARRQAAATRGNGRRSNPTTLQSEAALHDAVAAECARRGWLVFHGSAAHRTHRTLGEPDLTILCDEGRLLLVELKTGTGKLSVDQQGVIAWAAKLGHAIHVVRSLEGFSELIT
jgi:hypothetical protein